MTKIVWFLKFMNKFKWWTVIISAYLLALLQMSDLDCYIIDILHIQFLTYTCINLYDEFLTISFFQLF